MNIIQSNKLASRLLCNKVETKLLAICPITGIAITVESPAIEGFALEYKNPLSLKNNFLSLSELPNKQLLSLEPVILAGILLAILKDNELMRCPLSSAAQNLSLQSIFPATLVESIKFFSSTAFYSTLESKRKLLKKILVKDWDDEPEYRKGIDFDAFPLLSLSPKDVEDISKSSISNVVKNYKEACDKILFPRKESIDLEDTYDEIDSLLSTAKDTRTKEQREAINRAKRTKEASQKALLQTGRKLLRTLIEANIMSDKLTAFLKILFTGDYLLNAEAPMKQRLAAALLKHLNPEASALARIIIDKDASNDMTSIFPILPDTETTEEVIEAIIEKKLSLKEIIALKLLADTSMVTEIDTDAMDNIDEVEVIEEDEELTEAEMLDIEQPDYDEVEYIPSISKELQSTLDYVASLESNPQFSLLEIKDGDNNASN